MSAAAAHRNLRLAAAAQELSITHGPLWNVMSAEERRALSARWFQRPRPAADDRDGKVAELSASWALSPVLAPGGPQCAACRVPLAKPGICTRCRDAIAEHPGALTTLEFIAMAGTDAFGYLQAATWKKVWHRGRQPNSYLLDAVSVALSAYFEAHHDRLLSADPVVTLVPTGAPVIEAAFNLAQQRGWLSVACVRTGTKVGDWRQHDRHEHLTPAHWKVDDSLVAGRRVLLLDDFLMSGQSVFSYAAALRAAGATHVQAVVVERIVRSDYYATLAWLRPYRDVLWEPSVAYPAEFEHEV